MPAQLRLRLLGEVNLTAATGETATARLLQPRKLALLSYLALEERAVPRQEIVGTMWGDVPEDRARASLSQLLHSIRKDCPADPFMLEGQGIRLDPHAIACDVSEFYAAATHLPASDLVHRTARTFMPGFVLAGESGFDEWCTRERRRFELTLADVAWTAAESCRPGREQLAFLEVAAALRPWDEAILRSRMRAMAGIGERAAALALYEAYRRHAIDELGTAPGRASQQLAADLIGSGGEASTSQPEGVPDGGPDAARGDTRSPWLAAASRPRAGQLAGMWRMVVRSAKAGINPCQWRLAGHKYQPGNTFSRRLLELHRTQPVWGTRWASNA